MKQQWPLGTHPLLGLVLKDGKPWHTEVRHSSCGEHTALTEVSRMLWYSSQQDKAVVILGEVHDNSRQHEFRGTLVGGWLAPSEGQTKVGVVLEQLNTAQEPGLAEYADRRGDVDTRYSEFKRLVGWGNSAWAKYHYEPLLRVFTDFDQPIYAGDVSRADMMKAAKEGPAAIPADERARLKLDTPLGEKLDAAALAEIEDAHCGKLPKEMLPNMAFAQRYRDAHLADVTLKAAEKHGSAVLFTGNGHARTDRGVPWYIRQRNPDRKVVSVLLVEVEDGKTDPEAYVPRDPDGKPAADYIVFTPLAERPDPCSQMPEIRKE